MTTEQAIVKELKGIRQELDQIKHQIELLLPDPDDVLTEDDVRSLDEAEEDLKKGRTVRLV